MARAVGQGLCVLLAADALAFVLRPVFSGGWTVRGSLPLDLCDVALVIAALACWFPHWQLGVELTYFWGLAGSLQAVVTPDLAQSFPSLQFFVFVVGHVTKGGGIAGPKTLEHIVDTVLYFEGEGTLDHRVLRATKNRFGSVDEIGVFRMTQQGLIPVENASALFLGDREGHHTSGSAITAILEGTRPMLLEVQALAAKAGFGTPQRVAGGYDARRLALLLAVLDKRAGLSFANLDVFLNVVGGVRMQEPAGDLAVAAALASSVYDKTLPADAVFVGEVGLGGEIRAVSQVERRIAEAEKMGMKTAYVGERSVPRRAPKSSRVEGGPSLGDLGKRLFR